jgi:hypothetical protein
MRVPCDVHGIVLRSEMWFPCVRSTTANSHSKDGCVVTVARRTFICLRWQRLSTTLNVERGPTGIACANTLGLCRNKLQVSRQVGEEGLGTRYLETMQTSSDKRQQNDSLHILLSCASFSTACAQIGGWCISGSLREAAMGRGPMRKRRTSHTDIREDDGMRRRYGLGPQGSLVTSGGGRGTIVPHRFASAGDPRSDPTSTGSSAAEKQALLPPNTLFCDNEPSNDFASSGPFDMDSLTS